MIIADRNDSVVCGITVRDKLGAQTNPDYGVEITIKNAGGITIVDATVATAGQYDEKNSNTTGQYYCVFSTVTVGLYTPEFNIDPDGVYEGVKVDKNAIHIR